MIPVLLLLGAVLGRWWRTALVVAAVGWPAALVAAGVMDPEPGLLGASVLAAANAGVGLLFHHALAWAWCSLRTTVSAA